MIETTDAHCPYCKKVTPVRVIVSDPLASDFECTVCHRSWQEVYDV